MKKIFSLLILPLVAIIFLCACNSDKSYEDVKKLYEQTTQVCVIDEDNKFFGDSARPNSLTIKYSSDVDGAINNTTPVTKLQKKYVVIGYQQKILDYIFNYYEENNENFYKEISSAKINKKEMNSLYSDLASFNSTLTDFKKEYTKFCDATQNGVTSEFNVVYSDTVKKEHLYAPMHYIETNSLTPSLYDPYSKEPSYKTVAVNIIK